MIVAIKPQWGGERRGREMMEMNKSLGDIFRVIWTCFFFSLFQVIDLEVLIFLT